MPLKMIISGGQTGVDQAALRAALHCGLECGGWCPPGRVCESGFIPSHFPLKETPGERSPAAPGIPRSQRTEWNVRESDGTLILQPRSPVIDPGTEWTKECTVQYQKPLLVCDPYGYGVTDTINRWLEAYSIQTLNVAGPSENTVKGIGEEVFRLLTLIFFGRSE